MLSQFAIWLLLILLITASVQSEENLDPLRQQQPNYLLQHEPFLPPVDSPIAEHARAVYEEYFGGGLTLTQAMARIDSFQQNTKSNEKENEGNLDKQSNGERKETTQGALYAATVVALMAEHFYFSSGYQSQQQQGIASAAQHQGSSANSDNHPFASSSSSTASSAPFIPLQTGPSFVPPRREKVLLVLSLFKKARDLARLTAPTHHFLSVKLFRLLLFLDRCDEALQLADRYVARARKLTSKRPGIQRMSPIRVLLVFICFLLLLY
jgi:hypothetical protein